MQLRFPSIPRVLNQTIIWVLLFIVVYLLLRIGLPVLADAEEWFVNFIKVALIIIALTLGLIEIRRLNRRLNNLSRAAEDIGRGRYDIAVNEEGTDAVATLGRTLNLMARRIQDAVEELENSRQELEKSQEAIELKNTELTGAYHRQSIFGKFLTSLNVIKLDRIIQEALPYIMDVAEAQVCVYYHFDETRQKLVRRGEKGLDRTLIDRLGPKETVAGLPGEVFSRQESILVDRLQKSNLGSLDLGVGRVPLQFVLGLPVSFQNKAIGVILLSGINTPATSQRESLHNYVSALAHSLSNALAYQLVKSQFFDIKQNNARLLQLDQQKDKFVSTLSHELRTPLNSIIGFSQILMENGTALPPEDADRLQKIHRNGRRLLQMINDILDFSRIEAGHVDLTASEFIVSDLLQEVSDTLEPLASAKHLDLQLELPAHPVSALTDEGKVRQILINLVGNAIKFTPEGYVYLRLKEDPLDDEHVTIEVQDTGIGISENLRKSLFQPYQRGVSNNFEGTGLGLAICKSYTEELGGQLSVESQEGQGSIFTLVLPLYPIRANSNHVDLPDAPEEVKRNRPPLPEKKAENPLPATPASVEDEPENPVAPLGLLELLQSSLPLAPAQKVLVVDDDEDTRALICDYLIDLSLHPVPCADSTQVMAFVKEHSPDLITLDLNMPTKNGWTVLRELREHEEYQDIPVLIISIHEKISREIPLLGAHTLPKPSIHTELPQTIRQVSGRRTLLKSEVILFTGDEDLEQKVVAQLKGHIKEIYVLPDPEKAFSLYQEQNIPIIIFDEAMQGADTICLLDLLMDKIPQAQMPLLINARHHGKDKAITFDRVLSSPSAS